jgi:hypothetical protein
MIMAVRQARQSVLPLWCDSIGLDAAQTSLIFGLSGAVDMLLFYPAGSVMDRFGPGSIGIPSMLVLALSHAVLPFATTAVGGRGGDPHGHRERAGCRDRADDGSRRVAP